MKALSWLIGLFALAVGITLLARLSDGFVLLFVPPWRIEISLNTLLIGLTVLVALLYLLTRMVVEVAGLPQRVRRYRARRQQESMREAEHNARLAYYEGRYQRAEKLAAEAAALADSNTAFAVNQLLAVRAAHATRNIERRDQLFARLQERVGTEHLASLMTMAELYLDAHQNQEADRVLQQVRALAPKLTSALRLELRLRQREGRADAVLKLVDQLQRAEALEPEQTQRIRRQAHLQQLQQRQLNPQEVHDWWKKLPENERFDPLLVAPLAHALLDQQAHQAAREVIEHTLAQQWDDELVLLYGQLELDDEAQIGQLQHAETWLKQHTHDASLLLTLGRLCRRHQLWGKAQNYLEASIGIVPSAIAHAELASLLDGLERPDDANRHYRASLELALNGECAPR